MACASVCPRCGFSILDVATLPPFPHPELLVSEAVPTDSEAAAVHAAISTTEKTILAIEEEMERLGRALKECTARRKELRVFGYKQRSALSLFRRLPHEVLAEVFLRHQEDEEDSGDLRRAPKWIVAQVCGRWRAVALSTPRLWTSIKILPPRKSDVTAIAERSFVSLLSLQIERSGELPLTLRYRARYTSHMFSADTRRCIINLLLSVAYRWQDAILNLHDEDSQTLTDFTGAFPLMSTLEIWHNDFSPLGSIFSACPHLQHLTLPPHPRADLSKFPWAQLKTLTLHGSPPEDILRIVRQMRCIEVISLYVYNTPAQNTTTIPKTTSETLKILQISSCLIPLGFQILPGTSYEFKFNILFEPTSLWANP